MSLIHQDWPRPSCRKQKRVHRKDVGKGRDGKTTFLSGQVQFYVKQSEGQTAIKVRGSWLPVMLCPMVSKTMGLMLLIMTITINADDADSDISQM